MSAYEIRKLAGTLKVWREECGVHPVHIWDAHVEMESALLNYAETLERIEACHADPYGINDLEYNYILRGNAGKEEK